MPDNLSKPPKKTNEGPVWECFKLYVTPTRYHLKTLRRFSIISLKWTLKDTLVAFRPKRLIKAEVHVYIRKRERERTLRALASHHPGFDSRTWRHMWVEFVVGSLPCSERFFSGYSGFPLSSKTNISKFQFDLKLSSTLSWASSSGDSASTPCVWH